MIPNDVAMISICSDLHCVEYIPSLHSNLQILKSENQKVITVSGWKKDIRFIWMESYLTFKYYRIYFSFDSIYLTLNFYDERLNRKLITPND